MNDQRTYLKIKIKNLAAEAGIIRTEERKTHGMAKWDLQHHRKTVVRNEARRSLIAYQFIRGRDPSCHFHESVLARHQDWEPIERMVRKYGSAATIEALPKLKEAMQNHGQEITENACSHAA